MEWRREVSLASLLGLGVVLVFLIAGWASTVITRSRQDNPSVEWSQQVRYGGRLVLSDLDLGEDDQSEANEFTVRERRLITQSYDLSVNTLLEQWSDGTLTLPDIQRQYVWDNTRASRLIESLLLNIPIPVVYFSESYDLDYLVIDGHQRIKSIARFIGNEFALSGLKVLSDANKKRFHELSERDQRQLKTRTIRAIIVSADSDPMMKFEVFERLNTGSIALNAQEVRNSTHRGPMNEVIKELALDPAFRECVGTARPRPRMADNELILRHLALRSGWDKYRTPLSRFLNEYMSEANATPSEASSAADQFALTTRNLISVYKTGAFRLTDTSGVPLDKSINRALAEVQLTAFSWITDPGDISDLAPQIRFELGRLNQNQGFLDSIQRATGDKKRTLRRLGMFCDALEASGIKLSKSVEYEIV